MGQGSSPRLTNAYGEQRLAAWTDLAGSERFWQHNGDLHNIRQMPLNVMADVYVQATVNTVNIVSCCTSPSIIILP